VSREIIEAHRKQWEDFNQRAAAQLEAEQAAAAERERIAEEEAEAVIEGVHSQCDELTWRGVCTLVSQHRQPNNPRGWSDEEVHNGLAFEQALAMIRNGWVSKID
jgi:hypothetical protein